MDKYTYKDVIIDPTSEEAKNAIGKEAYYSDNPTDCLAYANNDDKNHLERFNSIEKYNCPFNFGDFNYSCLIVKKKEPYVEQAKKWIKENELKAGDYIKVLRKAEDHENGWGLFWIAEMDNCVGKTLRVDTIDSDEYGILLGRYRFPYFVLEKVEEPKSEYVPFKSAEEFISAYANADNAIRSSTELQLSQFGMWLKCCEHYELVTYIHNKGITIDDVSINWKTLFNSYTFLDGSSCGKLVEESDA